MFSPPLRKHYESLLGTILGSSPKKGFKSSMLLQAYATFSAMAEIDADLFFFSPKLRQKMIQILRFFLLTCRKLQVL